LSSEQLYIQKRRYQGGLGIVEPRGELVSCSLRISDQRGEHLGIDVVVHGVAAPLEPGATCTGSVARICASWRRRNGLAVCGGEVKKSGT
jgi:hypothetical protein